VFISLQRVDVPDSSTLISADISFNWLSINTFIKYLVVLFFYTLMITRVHACNRVKRTQKYYTQVLKLNINHH
jgi:hypothetical protein